ncbi:MAG: hypothetical protein OHK0022_15410 [Roseiflexaceae bacterium]
MQRRIYLQRKKSASSEADQSVSHFSVPDHSNGSPLPAPVLDKMQRGFGHSFKDVRIHNNQEAHESAEMVQAKAYTSQTDIVFNQGEFNPGSSEGEQLIAHELAHVVQQSQGPVSGVPVGGGVQVSQPGDRFEVAADTMAANVVSGKSVGGEAASGGGSGSAGVVQAKADEDQNLEELNLAEDETLQRKTKDENDRGVAPPELEQVIGSMPHMDMEAVATHTGGHAKDHGAEAMTVSEGVAFGGGGSGASPEMMHMLLQDEKHRRG